MGGRESWLNHNSCRWIHQPVTDYTSELVAKMVAWVGAMGRRCSADL